MAGGLDHVVHAVRDLAAAAELYGRLGFTVGARNRHAWGTHNQLIQLPGFFVELLTVAEPEKLGTDGFSALFGTFNRIFLKQQEGLSLLILESRNAAADVADFRAAKIGVSDAMHFEREGKRPDGSPVKVGFSLAFARDAGAPQIGFAACQQHYPENFWNPAFQQHANTVSGVAAATPRGDIKVMDPAAFRSHFGTAPPEVSAGARLAALQFRVRDRAALTAALDAGGITSFSHMGATIIAPENAMGATLVFEAT